MTSHAQAKDYRRAKRLIMDGMSTSDIRSAERRIMREAADLQSIACQMRSEIKRRHRGKTSCAE